MIMKRFLDAGSPLSTAVTILRNNSMIVIKNPEKMASDRLLLGSLARIHSRTNTVYTVWVLDEGNMNTIMIDVPTHLMGQYFRQHAHNVFPHLG